MDKKQSLAFLLSAMMVATPFSAFAAENGEDAKAAGTTGADKTTEATAEQKTDEAAQKSAISTQSNEGAASADASQEEGTDQPEASDKWEASDFTYGTWEIGTNEKICPSTNTEDYLKTSIHVVTGFSESGTEKVKTNKNLVIPAQDADGKKVQGVGANAFKNLGLKSVKFPENVKTANDTDWDNSVKERGDFFIGSTAFYNNDLEEVTLPEGVFYVGGTAFKANKNLQTVNFPSTIKQIGNPAFGQCAIKKLNFTETTDFPLCIDNMAFAVNNITSVWLPDNTEKVTNMAFRQSSGKVSLYIRKTNGGFIDNNSYQQAYIGDAIPVEAWAEKPWCVEHFTFDGTTITGLSDKGQAKIKTDTELVLPDKNPDGEYITAIGNGTYGVGTFGFKDTDGTVYAPDAVQLPSKLESIGNFAFSATINTATGEVLHGIHEITFPETLTTIGNTAFQNAPLTEVVMPDSVTSVGAGAFASNDKATTKITKVKLSKNLTAIPASMFNTQNIKEVEIPEGVTSIGMRAFAGNFIEKVTIPSTVTSIANYAFQNNQLKKVEIPATVKSIGNYAFQRTNEYHSATIQEVILHEGLESIGSKAFGQALTKECNEIVLPTTVKTLNANSFEGNSTVTLFSTVADQANSTGDYTKVAKTGTGHKIVLLPTITFDAGEGIVETKSAITDKSRKLTELPDATRTDYEFEGWYTAAEDGDKVTTDTVFDADATLYAHWQKKAVDTAAADKATDAVSKLDQADYTEETWKAVEDAKAELETAIKDGLQSKVDAAVKKLNEAVGNLVKAPLNTAAADKAKDAVSKLTKTDYTEESWKAVTDAQTELDKAIEDGTSQAKVNVAVEKLNKAVEALVKADLNKGEADKATDTVSKLNKSDYTADSWKAVEDAQAELETAIKDGLQSKVDAATDKLNEAVEALVKAEKPAAAKKIAKVALSTTTYTYNGKAKKPSVTVKDATGAKIPSNEYTVKYASGRKNVGKYTVTVTLKTGEKNTVNTSFRILPKKTSIKSLKKGKKSFTVKWSKQKTQVTGYQVQYSKSKKFTKGTKTKTIKGYKVTSKKVKKLSKKKTYYVRVRTYKKVGKTNYYAAWSKAKKVKTK